jgi:hypothetical protein
LNKRVAVGSFLALSGLALAAEAQPFFAPAEASGNVTVRLYPMENVAVGTSRLVTFGMPFTRGSVTPAQLSMVRVLRNGAEISAHVALLTPWRHATNPSIDQQSVRVARIQINHTFAAAYPAFETVTVQWGVQARTLNVPTLVDPRTGWHQVTSGSFVAADNVFEPDVYAVLPKAHLTKGILRPMRMNAFADVVGEARDNPAVMDATEHYPGYTEQDYASKNFFYSIINRDDPAVTLANQCPYKTDSEPWLYDRASSMFTLYFRSGFLTALRQAVQNTQFYKNKLYHPGVSPAAALGVFSLKVPNPGDYIGGNGAMYSYNECLAYAHWLTGDNVLAAAIPWVNTAHETQTEPTRWASAAGEWTERHTALRLLSNVVAYEVLGDAAYRTRMLSQSGDFIWHQNGAGGAIPAQRVDGGLWHWMRQHEGFDDPTMMASVWMSALTQDAMVRTYAFTEDPAVGHFVRRMGNFLKTGSRMDASDYGSGTLREVDYISYIDGTHYTDEGTTPEHALETAASLAWAYYFSSLLGPLDTSLKDAANELYLTYDYGANFWTRPAAPASGLTAYRVAPWRKYVWNHRVAGSLSWALSPAPTPTRYYTVTPCRLADTRTAPGPGGGPALSANSTRNFPVTGRCTVPADARAVAVNVTATAGTQMGNFRIYAAGTSLPTASVVNFVANRARANNAITALGTNGEVTVRCDMVSGSAHFVMDVVGYFK